MSYSARATVGQLQEEKICDQTTMIELQQRLMSKKDEEPGFVSKTVQKELKSCSSAMQQSFSTALSPRKIASAVIRRSPRKRTEQLKKLFCLAVWYSYTSFLYHRSAEREAEDQGTQENRTASNRICQ